jgi:hypothetical protein
MWSDSMLAVRFHVIPKNILHFEVLNLVEHGGAIVIEPLDETYVISFYRLHWRSESVPESFAARSNKNGLNARRTPRPHTSRYSPDCRNRHLLQASDHITKQVTCGIRPISVSAYGSVAKRFDELTPILGIHYQAAE